MYEVCRREFKIQNYRKNCRMFSVCKEHHAATAVEHAVACNFFNKSEKSLLVAGTRFLKVFRLIPNIESGVGSLQSGKIVFLFSYQALRVETANPLYFSAYIIRLLYKVADFVVKA